MCRVDVIRNVTARLHVLPGAVRRTSNRKFCDATDMQIQVIASTWLTNSRDRDGGRISRQKSAAARPSRKRARSPSEGLSDANTTPPTMRRGKQVVVPPHDTSEELFDDMSDTNRRSPSPSLIGAYLEPLHSVYMYVVQYHSFRQTLRNT